LSTVVENKAAFVSALSVALKVDVRLRKLLVAEDPLIVSEMVRMLRPAVETLPFTTKLGLHVRVPLTTLTMAFMAEHPEIGAPAATNVPAEETTWAREVEARSTRTRIESSFFIEAPY
jgi:hypothetical protein